MMKDFSLGIKTDPHETKIPQYYLEVSVLGACCICWDKIYVGGFIWDVVWDWENVSDVFMSDPQYLPCEYK